MKKSITLLAFLFLGITSFSQTHIQWTTPEITPGSQTNFYQNSTSDQSGNSYTIHFTQDPNHHYFTYRFFAYNNAGTKLWQYDNDSCFTDCQDIYSIIVPVDNDGAFFIGYYNDLTNPWQLRIKRIDLQGNLLWQNYWTPNYLAAYPVTASLDHSGNLVVALKAYVTLVNDEDFAFAKFDTVNGNNIWHTEIPDAGTVSGSHQEEIRSMSIDNADNIYACGVGDLNSYYFKVSSAGALDYQFTIQDNDTISIMINASGVRQILAGNNNDLYILLGSSQNTWLQKYEASTGNYIYRKTIAHDSATVVPVAMSYDNNCLYVISNYNYFIPDTNPWIGGHFTNKEYMITKIDTGGTTIWENTYLDNLDSAALQSGTGGADQMLLCNGNIYVLSTVVTDTTNLNASMVLNKVDAQGNIDWYEVAPADFGSGGMAADAACNIYVSRSVNLGSQYVHVITQQFSDNTTFVSTNSDDASNWLVYPNPAKDLININVDIQDNFNISIFNTVGEVVLREKNKKVFNVSKLEDGIYFIKLQSSKALQVKKFIKE